MIEKIQLFYEPLEILKKLSNSGAEMSIEQSAFVCGLIKNYKPLKVLEVGVAAGGTTAIMLNCISMLELNTEVYSVDISESYYRDKKKKTGYLAEECEQFLHRKVKHNMYMGGVLPEYVEKIGNDIDFLILDTVHFVPGELLDFLVCLPHLKDGAIVLLHDIIMNHLGNFTEAFATRLLYSLVAAQKIKYEENSNLYRCQGMGAFIVDKDTRKYADNIFHALMVTWNYIPENAQLLLYRENLNRYYHRELIEEFDRAIVMNKETLLRKKSNFERGLQEIFGLLCQLQQRKNIFIYGCGKYGLQLYNLFKRFGIEIEGFVISDDQTKPFMQQRVEYFSCIDTKQCTLVLGMSASNQKKLPNSVFEIEDNLICVSDDVLHFLRVNLS